MWPKIKKWCGMHGVQPITKLQEQKLLQPQSLKLGGHSTWNLPASLEPNAVLPYYYGSKGAAQGKLPLFLYLHGSGPKEQEWQTGLALGNLFKMHPRSISFRKYPTKANIIDGGNWPNSLLGRSCCVRL